MAKNNRFKNAVKINSYKEHERKRKLLVNKLKKDIAKLSEEDKKKLYESIIHIRKQTS